MSAGLVVSLKRFTFYPSILLEVRKSLNVSTRLVSFHFKFGDFLPNFILTEEATLMTSETF